MTFLFALISEEMFSSRDAESMGFVADQNANTFCFCEETHRWMDGGWIDRWMDGWTYRLLLIVNNCNNVSLIYNNNL